jgi:Class II flagellar assembly regulator
MRVTDRSPIAPASTQAPVARTNPASARFSLDQAGAAGAAVSAQSAAPAVALDGLIALQAAGDSIERQKRAMRRGRNLLDTLDDLKLSLLSGRIPTASLETLAAQLKQRRELADDPRLADILAHVELRAEVELAKLAKR